MILDVITTGGTIGGRAYPNPRHPPSRTVFPDKGHDPVADFLKTAPCGLGPDDYSLLALPAVDSKDLGESHIAAITRRLAEQVADNVLITHGTDTMLNTAELLHKHPASAGRRIILVGAMTPLMNGDASDGFQNLRFAIDRMIGGGVRAPIAVNIVLSDDGDAPGRWQPHLYTFVPGRFRKEYNPVRGDRSRLVEIERQV